MRNLWKRLLSSPVLPTLLLFYILISVFVYQRSSEKIIQKKVVKALVGYSLEYQTTEELKQTYKCDKIMKTTVNVFDNSVRLEYDKLLDVFFVRAFFDKRLSPYNYVRVVALVPNNSTLFCQIWRDGKNGDSRKATITKIWSEDWDKDQNVPYVPALINCLDTPGVIQPPQQITFTMQPCDNPAFRIQIKTVEKTNSAGNTSFTICVKPVSFFDGINRILKEWVFINYLLGVENILVYYYDLPQSLKEIPRVNFVHFGLDEKLFQHEQSFKTKTWLKRKLEVLAYNDCFYDNLYNTGFIIPLDIDELIVPKFYNSLKEIFESYRMNNILDKVSSFSVKNVYFFNEYPDNAISKLPLPLERTNLVDSSIFSRKIRSYHFSPGTESAKSIIYVPNTLTIFNHFAYHVLGSSIRQTIIPTNIAQLHHYRNNCDSTFIDNCYKYLNSVVYDDSLYRFINFSANC